MKLRHLLPAAPALLLCGCGTIGQTLATVKSAAAGLVGAVAGPLTGSSNLADEGSEKAWREKAAAQTQSDNTHDRRPVKTKRAR